MRQLLRFAWAVTKEWSSVAGLISTAFTYILLYFIHIKIPQWLPLALLAAGLLVSFLIVGTGREGRVDELTAELAAEGSRRRDAEDRIRVLEEEVKKFDQIKTKWRPSARIESAPIENCLVLKSDRQFKVERVSLLLANGAVFSEIHERDWDVLRSTGFRIRLPQDRITQLWNESSGPRTGSSSGALRVEVSHDDTTVTLELPFMARQEFHSNTVWIKLTG